MYVVLDQVRRARRAAALCAQVRADAREAERVAAWRHKRVGDKLHADRAPDVLGRESAGGAAAAIGPCSRAWPAACNGEHQGASLVAGRRGVVPRGVVLCGAVWCLPEVRLTFWAAGLASGLGQLGTA